MFLAFGGNTRDLGSFGEETDKITDLHGIAWKIHSQSVETASQFIYDTVWIMKRRRQETCDGVWICTAEETLMQFDGTTASELL